MKRATRRRIVLSLLLAMIFAVAAQARRQAPSTSPPPQTTTVIGTSPPPQTTTVIGTSPPPQTTAVLGVWDWLENALTTAPTVIPLNVAESPILGLWRLKSAEGGSPSQATAIVRQYASHPDGLLAMAEITIDRHAVPRFRVYSARPGVSTALYTDETFARFLLNGSRTVNTVSFRLVDRNSLSEVFSASAGPTPGRRSALSLSADGATLTEVTETLDSAGNPVARETLVFGKQTAALDPIRLPPSGELKPVASTPPGDAPFNPLIGTWALNETKSTAKPEAGSITLQRFIDLGRGAFGTLLVRLPRAGAPSLEMAAVKFEGPDDLVLALPIYTLAQVQIFLERDVLPASAVAYKMIDSRTVETTAKLLSNGKISAITTRRFTEDFMEFTETRKTLDAQGKPAGDAQTVYTRVSAN